MQTVLRSIKESITWLIQHHISVKLACIIIFFILAVFASTSEKFDRSFNNLENVLKSDLYKEWLLVVVILTGPMMIDLLLDLQYMRSCPKLFHEWFTKFLLGSMLLIPDLILYVLVHRVDTNRTQIAYNALNSAKLVGICGSMLCTVSFDEYFEVNDKWWYNLLSTCFLICLLLGEITLLFSNISYDDTQIRLYRVSSACILLGVICLFLTVYKLFKALWAQISQWSFTSHILRAEFCRVVALLLFCVPSLIIQLVIRNSGLIFNLGLQVLLIYFLTVLPVRTSKLTAKEERRKLEVRLDLLRYVSHEMRTPLNSAMLGLQMAMDNAKELETSYERLNRLLITSGSVFPIQSSEGSSLLLTARDLSLTPNSTSKCEENLDFELTKLSNSKARNDSESERHQALKWVKLEVARDQSTLLGQIQDCCAVAVSTLDDVLTFDKLDEGEMEVEMKELNAWRFLVDVSQPFQLNAKEKDVQLDIVCVEQESRWFQINQVKGDEFKLGQVLRNLISNALKFTPPKGKVTVKLEMISSQLLHVLSCDSVEAAGQCPNSDILGSEQCVIRLSVQDSGAGISKEDQKKLFGRYVQIKAGELQQGKGSGLGLWITKKIVNMHRGKVGVFSEGEGQGSTFYVDLPVHKLGKERTGLRAFLSRKYTRSTNAHYPESVAASEKMSFADLDLETGTESSLHHDFILQRKRTRATMPRTGEDFFGLESILSGKEAASNDEYENGNIRASVLSTSNLERLSFSVDQHPVTQWEDSPPPNMTSSFRKSIFSFSSFHVAKVHPGKDEYEPTEIIKSSQSGTLQEKESIKIINSLDGSLDQWDMQLHFLVVDDAPINRKLMKKVLEKKGHCVQLAEDGQECIELMESLFNRPNDSRSFEEKEEEDNKLFPIDVILIDDNMPRMSGVLATEKLRSMGYRGLIYGVTGDVDIAKRQSFIDKGANDCFTKPLDFSRLSKVIEEKLAVSKTQITVGNGS